MSVFFDTISSAVKGLIPGGVLFHPSYKIIKVAEHQYDFTWGLGVGTYHLSVTLDGTKFTITGDAVVIPADSVFPFNVIGQLLNGALTKGLSATLDAVSDEPVKLGMISSVSRVGLNEILKAPVGSVVEVAAVE